MKEKLNSILNKFFKKGEGTKEKAKERLKLILISDRASIQPQLLERLRTDLINTISQYIEIDIHQIDINLVKEETAVALTASMPIKRIKRGTGIKEVKSVE